MPVQSLIYGSVEEWQEEAKRRFGNNTLDWKFVCPSCGCETSVKQWKDAGAPENSVAFSCIGRFIEGTKGEIWDKNGGPCNYTGGGLFQLNPIHVVDKNGATHQMFAFAEPSADTKETLVQC